MEEIDEREFIHLHWLSQEENRNFVDGVTGKSGKQYRELLQEIYEGFRETYRKHGYVSRLAYTYYNDDIKKKKKIDEASLIHEEATKKLLKEAPVDEDMLWAFITVGFNEQTITPDVMAKVSQKIANLKYFKECRYVLEKHRENGIHHHTHFLVKFHKREYKSKLLGWIYQVRGLKQVCLSKNFIDILGPLNAKKLYRPYEKYYEYIHGNKVEEKLQYVEMDRKWRQENGISDLFVI